MASEHDGINFGLAMAYLLGKKGVLSRADVKLFERYHEGELREGMSFDADAEDPHELRARALTVARLVGAYCWLHAADCGVTGDEEALGNVGKHFDVPEGDAPDVVDLLLGAIHRGEGLRPRPEGGSRRQRAADSREVNDYIRNYDRKRTRRR